MSSKEQDYRDLKTQYLEQNNKLSFISNTVNTYQKTLEQMTELLESISIGIISFDSHGKTSIFNNQFLKMWKILEEDVEISSEDELFQMILPKINEPSGFSNLIKNINSVSEDGLYGVLYLKNGKIYEFICNISNSRTQHLGRVWTFTDITEHINTESKYSAYYEELKSAKQKIKEYKLNLKTSNELIRELNEKLEYTESLKSYFQENLTKMILIKINSLSEIFSLIQNLDFNEEQTKYLNQLQLNIEAIKNILYDLNNTSEVYSKNLRINLKPIDLNLFIVELKQSLENSFKRKIETIHLLENMPAKLLLDKENIKFIISTILQYSNSLINSDVKINFSAEKNKKSQKLINLFIEMIFKSHSLIDNKVQKINQLKHIINNIFDWENNLKLSICKKLIDKMEGEIIFSESDEMNTAITLVIKNIVVLDKAWSIMEEFDKIKESDEKSYHNVYKTKLDEELKNELNLIINDAKSLCRNLVIDDIEMFANKIHLLGLKNNNESLINYAQLLLDATNSLDINKIKILLNDINKNVTI